MPGANIHWYEKPDTKVGRKMGHITVTAAHAAEAMARLDQLMAIADGDATAEAKLPPSVGRVTYVHSAPVLATVCALSFLHCD